MKRKGQAGAIVIIVVLLVVIVGVALYFWNSNALGIGSSREGGRVVFAITDAAANMGSVSKVLVTVDGVSAHSSAEGWTEVSSSSKTYDLLELKAQNSLAVLADTKLDAGTYDQVRLDISKVTVVDAEGEHEAKLPSGELKINSAFDVDNNSTATATFDFIVDESLHVTGNGRYIMAPVVQVETRENAEAEVQGNNRVEISGGEIKTNVKVGMDAEGKVGVGLKIPTNVDVSLENNGMIKVGGILGIGGESDSEASGNAEGNARGEAKGDAKANVGVGNNVDISGNVGAGLEY